MATRGRTLEPRGHLLGGFFIGVLDNPPVRAQLMRCVRSACGGYAWPTDCSGSRVTCRSGLPAKRTSTVKSQMRGPHRSRCARAASTMRQPRPGAGRDHVIPGSAWQSRSRSHERCRCTPGHRVRPCLARSRWSGTIAPRTRPAGRSRGSWSRSPYRSSSCTSFSASASRATKVAVADCQVGTGRKDPAKTGHRSAQLLRAMDPVARASAAVRDSENQHGVVAQ